MKIVKRKIKDSILFAYLQGYYERRKYGDGFGRTHEELESWNEAYDRGANMADWASVHLP